MNKIILLSLFLCTACVSLAQNPTEIIAAWPNKKNLVLIDTLMLISKFDKYFTFYCEKKIEISALENKWDSTEIYRRKSKVSFTDFKDFTVYNALSFTNTKELQQFITFCKNSEKPRTLPFLILDKYPVIRNNLPLFVTRYLE